MSKDNSVKNKDLKSHSSSDDLTKLDALSYGLGNIPATMSLQLKSGYHMAFLTEIAGLSPAFVGLVNTATSIWDAINDPLIGGMADRTESKMGKYRPHMLWGILSLTVVSILMFYVPNLSMAGKNVYYTILLFLWAISITGFSVPWQSLNSVMSSDVGQRNFLLTLRMIIGSIAGTSIGIMFTPLLKRFNGGEKGYFTIAVIVAILALFGGLISIWGARKKDYPGSLSSPPKQDIKGNLKVLTSKPVLCIAIMLGGSFFSKSLSSALGMYYYMYVVGNLSVLASVSFAGMIASIMVLPFMTTLYKKFGRYKIFMLGAAMQFLEPILLFIIRENMSITLISLATFISTLGFSMTNMTIVSLVPDAADYSELNFGAPNAGLINAVVSFVKKFVAAFGTTIAGFALQYANYSKGMESTPLLVNTIVNVKSLTAFTLLVITVIAFKVFPLHGENGDKIRKELQLIKENQKNK